MAVVRALTLLKDGSFICAGHHIVSHGIFYLKKVLPTGQADNAFGNNGIVVDGNGKDVMAIAIQEDDKVLAAGYNFGNNAVVTRYDTDGSPDLSFGISGSIHLALAGWNGGSVIKDLQVLANGQILIALHGISSGHVGVARINADGSLDQTFAVNGIYALQENSPYDWSFVRTQTDGKIILCSTTSSGNDWNLFAVRLDQNGGLNSSFGDAGFSYLDVPGTQHARSLSIDEYDNTFIAGSTQPAEISPNVIALNVDVPRDFFVTKINSAGQLDTAFGNGSGTVSFDFGGADTCQAASVQPDGKIILAGMSIIEGVDYLALTRLDSSGNVDIAFGNEGKVLVAGLDLNAIWFEVTDVEIANDGKIYAAFTTGSSSFALAFNSDGSISRGYLLGTEEVDRFVGTLSDDILFGYTGDDILNGGSGNDIVNAGSGNDILGGGDGSDELVGGDGNDTYVITDSNDTITETLDQGIDTVETTVDIELTDDLSIEVIILEGVNEIDATGNDLANDITGNDASNTIEAGSGDDIVNAGGGDDVIIGGHGAGDDTYDGGSGSHDRIKYVSALANITINLNTGVAYATAGNDAAGIGEDTLTNIEDVTAGNYNDTIIGDSNANNIDGGLGNDSIDGGLGIDIATYSGAYADYTLTDNQDGTWAVLHKSDNETDTLTRVEKIQFSDRLYTLNYTITGTASADKLIGTSGDDYIDGLEGNDTLYGLSGNDTLNGGNGKDKLIGGLGDDTYVVNLTSKGTLEDTLTEKNSEGNDTIQLSGTYSATKFINFTLGNSFENLDVSATGSSNLNLKGNRAVNILTGNDDANTLDGGVGADTLIGGHGGDTYLIDSLSDRITEYRDGGNDIAKINIATANGTYTLDENVERVILTNKVAFNLIGSGQDNSLTGNAANNSLTGGGGRDTFIFNTKPAAKNIDTITDFYSEDDSIHLSLSIFKALSLNQLSNDAFNSGAGMTTAQDADDRIIYNTTTGALYYDPDGSVSKGKIIQFATLSDHPDNVTAADFWVI